MDILMVDAKGPREFGKVTSGQKMRVGCNLKNEKLPKFTRFL